MSIAIVYTRAKNGIEAPLVNVETHISNGLPSLSIVGLPETAVKESKDRVRSAIINSHFDFPSRRITINLAPADLPKGGGRYDLAIALGILAASSQIPAKVLQHYEFLGELGLSGELRATQGALSAAIQCSRVNRTLVIAPDNLQEAILCEHAAVITTDNLLQLCAHLHGRQLIQPAVASDMPAEEPATDCTDLSDIKGQTHAKRALQVAAAGQHNIVFCGPPGTGKTLLASRLPSILPPLTHQQMLEVATVYSISGQLGKHGRYQRPFRSPHHTASAVALVGGGRQPKPGEVSLAHCGVLFLDEMPEFQRQVLETIREPMESGEIMISRASQQVCFPASFQLVGAMNPCPCGYFGDPERNCRCSTEQVRRYRDKISGPLLDRIDLQVTVNRLSSRVFTQTEHDTKTSEQIREQVARAWQRQLQRAGKTNARLNLKELDIHCALSHADATVLHQAIDKFQLSPRAYHRILRVARTIADLDEQDHITSEHLYEALAYRALDKAIT